MDIVDPVWTRRRRLWVCGTLLVMGGGVVAYRSYSGKEAVAGWSYLQRVRKALRRYSEAFLMGSEVSSLLLKDLQTFLASDAQELPQSFKQLFRLAQSQEFQHSTAQVVAAAVKGVKDGAGLPDSGSGDFLEKLIAAFSTDKGSNLLTLAIGVACKSSTNAWCEHQSRQDAASAAAGQPDNLQRLFSFAGTREGQQLTQSSIRTFVREGTSVYMDKLEGTNSYADMLEAISRPGNGAVAERLTKVFVREMITSYFQKSSKDSESSSSQVEDVTHTLSTPRPIWQASTCAVDAQCQLSSFAQQPDIIGSPVDGAAVFSSCRSAVLPLVADATASSASLGEAAFPGDSSKQQQLSTAEQSMDMQQSSSSNQWSQQIIQVLKVPEARALMLTLAAMSSAQGVRGACLALKDLVVGESGSSWLAEGSSSGNAVSTLRKPAEIMCKTVGVIFLIIVAMLVTACADSPGFCFAV